MQETTKTAIKVGIMTSASVILSIVFILAGLDFFSASQAKEVTNSTIVAGEKLSPELSKELDLEIDKQNKNIENANKIIQQAYDDFKAKKVEVIVKSGKKQDIIDLKPLGNGQYEFIPKVPISNNSSANTPSPSPSPTASK